MKKGEEMSQSHKEISNFFNHKNRRQLGHIQKIREESSRSHEQLSENIRLFRDEDNELKSEEREKKGFEPNVLEKSTEAKLPQIKNRS